MLQALELVFGLKECALEAKDIKPDAFYIVKYLLKLRNSSVGIPRIGLKSIPAMSYPACMMRRTSGSKLSCWMQSAVILSTLDRTMHLMDGLF
jgi:hypothetical protein